MHVRANSHEPLVLDRNPWDVARMHRALNGAACVFIVFLILWSAKLKDDGH